LAATSSDAVVAVLDAPKPPATRVSLSIPTMRRASHRLVAAFGAEKQAVIRRIRGGWESPAVQVRPTRWYLDRAAAEDIRG
jgi:6-phosphogluconolactonase